MNKEFAIEYKFEKLQQAEYVPYAKYISSEKIGDHLAVLNQDNEKKTNLNFFNVEYGWVWSSLQFNTENLVLFSDQKEDKNYVVYYDGQSLIKRKLGNDEISLSQGKKFEKGERFALKILGYNDQIIETGLDVKKPGFNAFLLLHLFLGLLALVCLGGIGWLVFIKVSKAKRRQRRREKNLILQSQEEVLLEDY